MLKSSTQSNCPMTRPPAPAPPALGCLHGSCCIGGAPWCSANPSPAPLLQGVVSEAPTTAADRPQECALALGPPASPPDATHACMTQAVPPRGGPPANSQTPTPPLMQAGVPPAQGQIALPPPRGPLSSPVCPPPSCQRTHLSPIPGHQPWVSVPSCPLLAPQHPVLRLPAVTMEGIWYETNKEKQKPNLIYAISVCLYL